MTHTQRFIAWMERFADLVDEHAGELTELDRLIGDGDHGVNMVRGMTAVRALSTEEFADPTEYLKKVGLTLVAHVGGAAGPLYGTFFMKMAAALPHKDLDAPGFIAALENAVMGVQTRGKANRGDKTMLDALLPAAEAAHAHPESLSAAISAAHTAACRGAQATIQMIAHKGRASYLGSRSCGVQDPGSASSVLLLHAAEVLGE
ncbi:dihydroxyacetone kinase subunit DhaL [Trueperella sp. LYQ143]|uniref:dihydroxyacetone kinase subunit DhaL n=1 Tax=Trueperella sp. LYQ143 TaxID=3391059 RepID=UPI003982F851